MSAQTREKNRLRLSDFLVVLLCLSITAYSLNLFRLDLFQTINQQNVKPVGTISIKSNIVQRRIADRVLWDRLRVESPVYSGDLIRTAELSSATLHIEEQDIDIDENTLIRIVVDESGAVQVELSEGKLSVTTREGGLQGKPSLQIIAQGKVITAGAGTSLSATAGNSGLSVQVSEGKAALGEETLARGTMLSFDSEGGQRNDPAVVVTNPRPNARYVKYKAQPLSVNFAWNRVNLQPQDSLRLEIAADKNFTRDVRTVENLNASAAVSLEAGQWNWRISYQNTILSSGRLTVTDASNLNLSSPANGSLFRYQDNLPSISLQWPEIENALYYNIEISQTEDFANPRVRRQTDAPSFTDAGLGAGTWYWRVQPVFPSAYEGGAGFSQKSSFNIEQAVITSVDEAVVPPKPVIVQANAVQLAQQEEERQRAQEAEKQRAQQAERQRAQQAERQRTQEAERQRVQQAERQRAQEAERQRVQEAERQRVQEAERQRVQEAERQHSQEAERQRSQPTTPLPTPGNRLPANGYHIGIEELKAQRNIVFSWSTVPGANGYTITLYEQTANGRRQIQRIPLGNITRWTLENVGQLGRGTFIWQVEASYSGSGGTVERTGTVGENSFVIDVPLPEVHMENPGVLYGF